ncbi:hypothetical protein PQQ51_31035 [Paraburkholderia xenovorans]|uniref:hypothetical protein n=1 Tax=Paraburkholderia xenovorans TaxID=36873 RepID=UPI0038B804C2
MARLAHKSAEIASLLLNLEGVLTAVIWIALRENTDRWIVVGMPATVAGSVPLFWQAGASGLSVVLMALALIITRSRGGRQSWDQRGQLRPLAH